MVLTAIINSLRHEFLSPALGPAHVEPKPKSTLKRPTRATNKIMQKIVELFENALLLICEECHEFMEL